MVFQAYWERHRRAAGPIRNAQIVEAAEEVVAFWNGSSRGTLNTIVQAVRKGLAVRVIGPDGQDVPLSEALSMAEQNGVTAAIDAAAARRR